VPSLSRDTLFRQTGHVVGDPQQKQSPTEMEKKMKHTRRSTRLNNWQEAGVILGGILVDSAKLINQALPKIANSQHRAEIEQYCGGTENGPYPSEAAINSLKAAIINMMMGKPE
jgi:hypothetical protein